MGFDCTLHVVDEQAFARFAQRFLGGDETTPFDRAFDRAPALVAKTRDLIATDPDRGARALAELALLFVSAETPHVDSRGFALSLWDDGVMGTKLPEALIGSVEPMLEEILRVHPVLRGRVPRWMESNYCVGPFVRASDVPRVLAVVERALDAMVPGTRRPYVGLRDVLRLAAARGLAYWEGTDLGVVQAHAEWLDVAAPSEVMVARAAFTPGLDPPLAMRGTELLIGKNWKLWAVDIASFPPTARVLAELHVIAGAFMPDGRIVAWAAVDPTTSPYVFAAYLIDASGQRTIESPPFPIHVLRAACGTVLAFPFGYAKIDPSWRPMAVRGDRFVEIDAPAPEPPSDSRTPFSCDAFELADGTALVVWDGRTYRWDGGAALVPFGPRDRVKTEPRGLPNIAPMDGGVACLFGRRVVRVGIDGERASYAPLSNAMLLTPGPEGALVIREGDNPEGDALKILWPTTDQLTAIEPGVLGVRERIGLAIVVGERLLVTEGDAWCALDWSAVRALPRVAIADFAIARARSDARIATEREKRKRR
jgi:hypothetical protein